ncbi:hypothetical protein YPPY13_4461, partial [Yersinia pestis PY-13]
MATIGW